MDLKVKNLRWSLAQPRRLSGAVGARARQCLGDRGSVSVEAALSLSALVIVLAAMVAAMATVGAHISAVDTAGAAARAFAIGVDFEPVRGRVSRTESGGLITVTAVIPAPLGEVTATAIFPQES